MKDLINRSRRAMPRWASIAISAVLVWALIGAGFGSPGAVASGSPGSSGSNRAAPDVVCPSGQCFTDVPASNPFYGFINALYTDNIISGYPCGGTGEPCDTQHRPYFRPGNNVTRGQMAKFVDNGRRNIADAVGTSLVISGTVYNTLSVTTNSGGSAIVGQCLTPSNACYAVAGGAPTGDFAGYFAGGSGVYAGSQDSTRPALNTVASGSTAYGVNAYSQNYRGLDVSRGSTLFYSLYVDRVPGEPDTGYVAEVNGSMEIVGNLTVNGSKSGYVVDLMQNVDASPLEPGDVVVIAGSAAPILGQIPVVTVRKATGAYDTRLAGVVDQEVYVPDAATRSAYAQQQEAQRIAQAARAQELQSAAAAGRKPDLSGNDMPQANITDAQGTVHATDDAQVPQGGYANVVTLGAYKAIKVDASFGPIQAGDLLTTSPHAGYAMKVTDKSQALGATIGKALAGLDSGTGLIPVLVTLK
jgi:hypothetical protein